MASPAGEEIRVVRIEGDIVEPHYCIQLEARILRNVPYDTVDLEVALDAARDDRQRVANDLVRSEAPNSFAARDDRCLRLRQGRAGNQWDTDRFQEIVIREHPAFR